MRIALLMPFIAMASLVVRAQPPNSSCATAALLCAEQALSGNNTGSTSVPGFCPSTQAAVWYTFTTNSVGGPVTVTVDNIDCPAVAGMDDELSVVVLSGDGSCTLASFSGASTCALGDDIISLTSLALAPSTEYWILVSGAMNGGATIPAQCGFTVDVTGPGAVVIGVDVSAGPDVVIGEGSSTQLQGIGNTFDWSPTSGLSGNGIPDPIAAPSGTTIYTLTSVIGGCTYTDEVIVEVVRLIEPPNTFTPNGDGINDTWEIPGIADYPGAEVTIHDRWGQRVLQTNGYREPWDGTNNGRAVGVGTYYYHIQLNQLEGRSPPYTGFVTIVR
ncbi:MAG: gliding motility-associated C-terminal domain-containing protein [Flavobacteriales bacterium]|nr:gliding motility-associated C-terminal domain-containing protein [Flavobacteriales bacterium]